MLAMRFAQWVFGVTLVMARLSRDHALDYPGLLHILEEHGFLDLGEYLMLHTRESGPEALEFLSDCLRRQLLHG